MDVFDLEGRSALHLAAEHGYINVCDALLEHKAFINSKSRIGYTALHMAAQNGYTMLVKSLIKEHSAVIDVLTLASSYQKYILQNHLKPSINIALINAFVT